MEPIDFALDELKSQKKPLYRATARKYGCDHQTLRRRHLGIQLPKAEYHETQQLLSNAQERVLINYINELNTRGIPPPNCIVHNIAAEICGKQPGKTWVYEFIERHKEELKSVILDGFDLSRKNADNYISIKQYFDLV